MINRIKAILAVLKGKAIVVLNNAEGKTEVYMNMEHISSTQAKKLSNDLFKVAYNLN